MSLVNPTTTSKDLGLAAAIVKGATPPLNTDILWLDTTTNIKKLYDVVSQTWVPIAGGSSFVINLKTPIIITDGTPVIIHWSSDIPPNETVITYLQKHGQYPQISEENQGDDLTWTQNAAPSYSWNSNRTILTLTPQTTKTNFIII